METCLTFERMFIGRMVVAPSLIDAGDAAQWNGGALMSESDRSLRE